MTLMSVFDELHALLPTLYLPESAIDQPLPAGRCTSSPEAVCPSRYWLLLATFGAETTTKYVELAERSQPVEQS